MKTILLIWLSMLSIAANAESLDRLLLVTSQESTVAALSNNEVKRLFLGVLAVKNGQRLQPLRNATDTLITEVFLQKIVFMSKRHYEREITARVFRDGGSRPPVYKDLSKLVDELRRSPESLTYMWESQLEQSSGLKSIGVLWQGSVY